MVFSIRKSFAPGFTSVSRMAIFAKTPFVRMYCSKALCTYCTAQVRMSTSFGRSFAAYFVGVISSVS